MLAQVLHRRVLHIVDRSAPYLDHRLGSFLLRSQTHAVHLVDPSNRGVGALDNFFLFLWNEAVLEGDCQPGEGRIPETQGLQIVEHIRCPLPPKTVVGFHNDLLDGTTIHHSVVVTNLFWEDQVQLRTAEGGIDQLPIDPDLHWTMKIEVSFLAGLARLHDITKSLPRTLRVGIKEGEVVVCEDRVLRGEGNRLPVRRGDDVPRGSHQFTCLRDRFRG